MKKLRILLTFIKLLFSNFQDVLKRLANISEELKSKNIVVKKHGLPKGIPSIDLLDVFPDFKDTVDHYTFLEGTSRITDIAILRLLAKRFPDGKYLELGTWRGESIANVSALMKECVSISFSEQDMKAHHVSQEAIDVSRILSKNLKNVKHIGHNTQTYDYSGLEKSFALIFVDADHKYEGVRKDVSTAFKLLRNSDSVIVFHDASKSLEDVNWEVQAGILDGAPDDEHRNKIYKISNSLCAIYTNGNYKSHYPKLYMPNKLFSLTISAKKFNS